MTHLDELEKAKLDKAEQSLCDYAEGVNTTNAGWNILRYAEQGLYDVKSEYGTLAANMIIDWYPNDFRYAILRMAKASMLKMREI